MSEGFTPPKRLFKCRRHGVLKESGIFPNTLGLIIKGPAGRDVRICPKCLYELLVRECEELEFLGEEGAWTSRHMNSGKNTNQK